jgi:hypothetical protein
MVCSGNVRVSGQTERVKKRGNTKTERRRKRESTKWRRKRVKVPACPFLFPFPL